MKSIELKKGAEANFEKFMKEFSKLDIPSMEEFAQKINQFILRKKTSNFDEKEAVLLEKIYLRLPEKTEKKYKRLVEKLETNALEEKEQKELNELIELVQEHDLQWLEAMAELAEFRGVSFEKVKEQLGFSKHPPLYES